MRLKLKYGDVESYQSGGALVMPYMAYTEPAAASTAAGATKSTSSEKGLTDKDIAELLTKADGLPSDISVITNDLENFYTDAGLGIGSILNTSKVASRYIQTASKIQVAKYNRDEYDNAYKNAEQKGALDEWAITDRGQFVCATTDGGEFKFITPQQFKEDMEGEDPKYIPLTNSELLYYRANDAGMAFQNKVLSVVQNGIGMSAVTDLIQNAMSSLGSVEKSDEGYGATRSGKLIEGLEAFEKAVNDSKIKGNFNKTTDNLYKYNYLSKSQMDNANAAFAYIYNMLPTNAKTLLKAKSDLTEEGAQKLVQTLVASKVDTTSKFGLDLVGGKGAGTGSGDDGSLKDTQLINFVKGNSGVKQTMTIDLGNGIQMSLLGRKTNLVMENDNKTPLTGDMSLSDMLTKSGIQNIVSNMQNITFGDQKVPPEALQGITYNGTGVLRANLPVNPDGTVNFSVLKQYEEAEQKVDALGHKPSNEERRKIFEEVGLAQLLTAEGTLDPTKFAPFLVTEGYTTDKLSGVQASDYVREIDKWNSKTEAALITKSLSTYSSSGKPTSLVSVDRKSVWPADWAPQWWDHIYKAAIYIPLTTNTRIAARTDRQNLDYSDAQYYENQYQNEDKIIGMKSNSSSLLGLHR